MENSIEQGKVAVIDIGSNSLRFVVFDSYGRYPYPLFNERITCRLGEGVQKTKKLKKDRIQQSLETIKRFSKIIDEAKFPPGVFNLVNGDGATTGDALTSHPDINMISFTGSTRAGALISQNAAKDFKRVSLELGGKGANIIFKDADPEAIERGALRCFRNSGQSCNAPTRMLVEKSMYDEAVERLKKYANDFKVDDPNKEGDHIGPVISETQYNKIQTLIQKGIDEGAKLISGGTGKPSGLDKGYYVKPTVFVDVKNDMDIAKTEIFGPVLSVMPFETEEEAIKIANDTPYGLTNYIQTQDPEKVKRVARKLRSGMVDAVSYTHLTLPTKA